MAKIGEGDPRWIVQERTDGTNVNSWHWQERDVTKQAHAALKEALEPLVFCENDTGLSLKVKEVADLSGDMTVAQRKQKIMCYFDLKFTVKYVGTFEGHAEKAEGKAVVSDLEHDNYEEDYDIAVTATERNTPCNIAEEWMRKKGRKVLRDAVCGVIKQIFAFYEVGKNVPPKQSGSPQTPPNAAPVATSESPPSPPPKAAPATRAAAPATTSSSSSAPSITWTMTWRCTIDDVWAVLTDQQRASMYTRAPAKIEPRNAGIFEFMGGAISGYFVEVVHPSKLVMQWRLSSWPSGIFSSVVILISKDEPGVTRVEFAQAGVPSGEHDRVKQGWMVNFWDPIKMLFGYQIAFL